MKEIFLTSSSFGDLFDGFLGFGKPKGFIFNSQVKDMTPFVWRKQDDDNYMCIVKTLGIEPNDLKVEDYSDGIKVRGESEVFGYKYNTLIDLPIAETIMNNIKEIKVNSKNGLTFIILVLDKPEKRKINIIKE
jgi:HSP20 family molecular chaperone IbpA